MQPLKNVYAIASSKCYVCLTERRDIDISNNDKHSVVIGRSTGEHVEFEVVWLCGECLHWNKNKFSVNATRHIAQRLT